MRRARAWIFVLLLTPGGPARAVSEAPAEAATPADEVDAGSSAEAESLRAAELAFAASVAARDLDRFASFLDEEAVFASGAVLRGREEIVRAWSVFFAEGGPRLVWQPEIVEVRSDGLGLSRGPYTLSAPSADGGVDESRGIFTSIWRRQPEGGWKILFDSGCPPTAGAEPAATGDG